MLGASYADFCILAHYAESRYVYSHNAECGDALFYAPGLKAYPSEAFKG